MPWHVSLIALGGIIGSCYFLELGATYNSMGPGAVLIAYLIAGITIYGVMQSFAEMLVNIPRRGSFVSYTRQFMGDTASAGIGWAFWANWVCYIPSEAIATAIFVDVLTGNTNHVLTFIWGLIALILLTLINVFQVTWFGHVESIMAIIKIVAIIFFIICGALIFFGIISHAGHVEGNGTVFDIGGGFKGLKVALGDAGASVSSQLFPNGGILIITLMIWTLVNFQGSEIVGLSAAETRNPEVNVPKACKSVAYRIILIYIVPIFVLSLIMPYYAATMDGSVFAQALAMYGIGWGAKVFTVVTLIAAFSCANSGFYGTVRSLYGLSVEGLAPKFLSKLNKFKTPQNATLFTLAFIWLLYLLTFAMQELNMFGGDSSNLFSALIGIAGFTGTLCWVGILYSQIVFRKRLVARGYDPKKVLGVKASGYPILAWFSVIVQLAAMVLLIFEAGDGLPIFVLSMDIIIIPIVIFAIQKYRGNIRQTISIGEDEVMFDDKFPVQSGSRAEKLIAAKKAQILKLTKPIGTIVTLIVATVVSVVVSLIALAKNPTYYDSEALAEALEADPKATPDSLNMLNGEEFSAIFTDHKMGIVWLLIGVLIVTYVVITLGVVKLGKYKPVKENIAV
jgi:AAT family amino acid transporter